MSYKIAVKDVPSKPKFVSAREMVPGEIGVVKSDGYSNGHYVLRVYSLLVSLTNPNTTWTITGTHPDFNIELVPEGVSIEITPGEVKGS